MTTAAATDRRVPEDRALPHLAALFDLDGMARTLSEHWSASEHGTPRVLGCEVERVKYRPGRNCVVGYRVHVKWPRRPGRTGSRRTTERLAATRIAAAMYPATEAESRYERAVADRADAGVLPPVSLLRDAGIVLWRFPHDRKLAALPLLADDDGLRGQWLPEIVAARFGADWRIVTARNELVSYFPNHSATLRSRLHLQRGDELRASPWHVYGKVRYDDSGERVFAAMTRLCASPSSLAGSVGFARPLALYREQRVLWQEGIDAPTLDRCLLDKGFDDAAWKRVAQAVAALHDTPLGLTPVITRESLLAEIGRALETLCIAVPAASAAVTSLASLLQQTIDTVDCAADATLHGDLHSKNILVGPDRVHLIDFDRVGAGPRLAEVGSLLAELVLRDCIAGQAVDWRRITKVAKAYGYAHGGGVDPWQLAWHVASALLRERAYRCVTSLKPGRLEILPYLLDAARVVLTGGIEERRA